MTESKKNRKIRGSILSIAHSNISRTEISNTKLLNLQEGLSSLDRIIEMVLNEEIEIDSRNL